LEKKLLAASELYRGKTLTVHNFIEKKPLPEKVTPEKPYVAFAARLSKEKGVTLLCEAAKLLPDYSFLVAGSGPDGECLKDIPNITMKGFLSGDELISLMANAKVMLLPSVWYENCPLSILETHSFGVPVITMNSGGMAELVEDGKTGALINEPTPEAVAAAIRRCFEDEEYYSVLQKNCETMRDKIIGVSEYSDIVVSQYQNLIDQR
jgi:glycosyltransferase involved in cell wall biosynthesis